MHRPLLEEVFKQSGLPTYTFVEPVEFARLLVALRTPGRGVVIEGPSGVGKTTAVAKALGEIKSNHSEVLSLTARKGEDRALIKELPSMKSNGFVVIDDFHRLDNDSRAQIADYLKVLADEEDSSTKVVVIGINRAGESLLALSRDLRGRIDVIRFERNSDDKVEMLVNEGAAALNVSIPPPPIVAAACGSFHLTQLLCHTACVAAGVIEYQTRSTVVTTSINTITQRVMDDQAMSFMDPAVKFAAGPRFSKEGRAPYLHMLRWLSASEEWTVGLSQEMRKHPDQEASVAAVVNGGHLEEFIAKNDDLQELIHYDSRTKVLAVEDPKFYFFIKNLQWGKFAERVGFLNIGYKSKYDFALSFAGSDRQFAEALNRELTSLEFAVFYDKNEQSRILATDIEDYLAPIYSSGATYVVCILGKDYPERLWTRFESQHFKKRFGSESVVPVWFADSPPSTFDEIRQIGAFILDRGRPLNVQAKDLAQLLSEKLSDFRLRPWVPSGSFLCTGCNLVYAFNDRAATQTSYCYQCAEKVLAGWDPPTVRKSTDHDLS